MYTSNSENNLHISIYSRKLAASNVSYVYMYIYIYIMYASVKYIILLISTMINETIFTTIPILIRLSPYTVFANIPTMAFNN